MGTLHSARRAAATAPRPADPATSCTRPCATGQRQLPLIVNAADAISHIEQLVPEAQGVLRAALHNDSPAQESYEIWSRERLVVRDARAPARLHRIEDRPTVRLLSDFRGKTHVFCIARPAFRLRRQFTFDADDDARPRPPRRPAGRRRRQRWTNLVDLVILGRPPHLT